MCSWMLTENVFYSNEDIFTELKLFFIHPNEKNIHLPALQTEHPVCVKINVEKPNCFKLNSCF